MTFVLEGPIEVVHMVKEVKCERGIRSVTVKCGFALPPEDANGRGDGWTIGNSHVSCPDCMRLCGLT